MNLSPYNDMTFNIFIVVFGLRNSGCLQLNLVVPHSDASRENCKWYVNDASIPIAFDYQLHMHLVSKELFFLDIGAWVETLW